MKAAVRSRYGPPDVLSVQDIEKPVPKDGEVLIRVHAASVNRSDYHVLTGVPRPMRCFTGPFRPTLASTGTDFAGQIESIGSKVRRFTPGENVMGFGGVFGVGSHAQYLAFDESRGVVSMPNNVTYVQAAACLEGAYYAATGLTQINPRAGQKALVYGATGAIGSAYVQLLKCRGLYVTAVCAGEHRELVMSLGADRIVDYKTEDFTRDTERYDFIVESALPRPEGHSRQPERDQGFVESGRFKPVIDRQYPIEKISEAFAYVATGQKIGNVIVTMD